MYVACNRRYVGGLPSAWGMFSGRSSHHGQKLIRIHDFGIRGAIWNELSSGKGRGMWISECMQSVCFRNFTMRPSTRTFHNFFVCQLIIYNGRCIRHAWVG